MAAPDRSSNITLMPQTAEINSVKAKLDDILDNINKLSIDMIGRLSGINERLARFEISIKFHSDRINDQEIRITRVENKVQRIEIENVRVLALEKEILQNGRLSQDILTDMLDLKKQLNKMDIKGESHRIWSNTTQKIAWIILNLVVTTLIIAGMRHWTN